MDFNDHLKASTILPNNTQDQEWTNNGPYSPESVSETPSQDLNSSTISPASVILFNSPPTHHHLRRFPLGHTIIYAPCSLEPNPNDRPSTRASKRVYWSDELVPWIFRYFKWIPTPDLVSLDCRELPVWVGVECGGFASRYRSHVIHASRRAKRATNQPRDNELTHLQSSIYPGDQSEAHIDIKQLFSLTPYVAF